MGTRMAPSYACIFMHRLETTMLNGYPKKPKMWRRYIDDIFMIWQHGTEELHTFMTYLNNFHQTIKFTMQQSDAVLPFLDVLVYKGTENQIHTTIYSKPTDAKRYLHYHSHHPRKQKIAVPIGLMIRARRICSEDHEFNKHINKIKNSLTNVKFPIEQLEEAETIVRQLTRNQLLTQYDKEQSTKVRLITPYNTRNPHMNNIIRKHQLLLTQTKVPATPPSTLQTTYSKHKNLRDRLVRSNHSKKKNQGPKSKPCNKPCATCPLMKTTNTITSTTNRRQYNINTAGNCQSHGMVYAITCRKCKKQYIGETQQTINQRFRGHTSCINKHSDNPVANHFNLPRHSVQDIQITILDRCQDKNMRLRLEESWMILLDTLSPTGINGRW